MIFYRRYFYGPFDLPQLTKVIWSFVQSPVFGLAYRYIASSSIQTRHGQSNDVKRLPVVITTETINTSSKIMKTNHNDSVDITSYRHVVLYNDLLEHWYIWYWSISFYGENHFSRMTLEHSSSRGGQPKT